jgi:hypothetical protein
MEKAIAMPPDNPYTSLVREIYNGFLFRQN